MRKNLIIISLIVIGVIISGFTLVEFDTEFSPSIKQGAHIVPTEKELLEKTVNFPFTGNAFIGFKEALAFKESQGKYHVVNTLGYLGKYQFGKSTLKRFNITNTKDFLQNPVLQEDAFIALCSVNKWILRKDIARSIGKTIQGIKITESGILAAAHLAGAGNVKKFLRSNGKVSFEDAYGSSIKYYLKKFSGYNTSFIEANRKPEV